MPGFILTPSALVICAHGGQAQPVHASARVSASGQSVVTLADSYVIAGCSLPPTPAPGPCTTGRFATAANRVLVEGQPVLVQSGASVCAPTGAPLLVMSTQQRVTAS